jgi:hypothetical protein
MIRLSDALILAGTKLRTHRVRTTITIVLSSLLFAALIAAVIMAQGVTKSITAFNNEGLNNRYIVSARADSPFVGNVLGSSSVITLAKQKGKDLIIAKQTEAKKLGIDYNANNEVPATITQTSPGYSPTEHINMQSYAVTEALQEYVKQHPSSSLDDLKKAAAPYHPVGFYTSINSASEGGDIKIMPSGSENFNPTDDQRASLEFSRNAQLVVDDSQLTKPFVYQNVAVKKGDIPLVVSYSTAESWLGLPQISANASAKQHYDRIQQLYKQTAGGGLTITTCYRNSVSQSQIDQAISQADEIAKNVNNKDYQKPSLIYGLPPANSCAQAPIISDTRTDAEKKTQATQDQFNSDFGQIVTPVQQKLTFQVIGLSPSESNDSKTTFNSLLAGIVGSSLTNGANVIPNGLLDQLPNAAVIKSILLPTTGNPLGIANPDYYVEFSNATDARLFIADKSCTTRSDGTCASPGRLFQLIASGNNSIALQDLQQKITSVLAIATLAIVVLAIIIMTTMVGRTVADGRRETAVFRALGAKRGDIGLIYSIYTLCLTLIIAVVSLAVGVGVAYGFNTYYGQDATLQAKLLFDAVNTNLNFSFFGINITILSAIVAVVLITGLISMIIPLLRNIRRNPIKDMREE